MPASPAAGVAQEKLLPLIICAIPINERGQSRLCMRGLPSLDHAFADPIREINRTDMALPLQAQLDGKTGAL